MATQAAPATPFGSPGRSASAEAAAKAAAPTLSLPTGASLASLGNVPYGGGGGGGGGGAAGGGETEIADDEAAPAQPQPALAGAAMALDAEAPAATPAALADYYYSTAYEKETDAIETICNSKSPINKAHAIYYFKNQEYFIDYCNEFVFLSNNDPSYFTQYTRLNDFLQREKFIAEIKTKDIDLIKKTYNTLICNIPSAKYDYYLYDCLREIIEGERSLSEKDIGLFYSGPTDDIFDDGLKKSHIFYYLQYIE